MKTRCMTLRALLGAILVLVMVGQGSASYADSCNPDAVPNCETGVYVSDYWYSDGVQIFADYNDNVYTTDSPICGNCVFNPAYSGPYTWPDNESINVNFVDNDLLITYVNFEVIPVDTGSFWYTMRVWDRNGNIVSDDRHLDDHDSNRRRRDNI
ncbi:MAG: hypothetical protein KAY37_13795 [Phycisphaerae bacterium]|nr:hypothetical protein [Phycisphaerae bacterium]